MYQHLFNIHYAFLFQSIVPAALNGLLANAHQTYGPIPSTGAHPSRPLSSADSYASSRDEQQKKAKIREALEKMKEAKMKKVGQQSEK